MKKHGETFVNISAAGLLYLSAQVRKDVGHDGCNISVDGGEISISAGYGWDFTAYGQVSACWVRNALGIKESTRIYLTKEGNLWKGKS